MKRKIITINEELCNGCGKCVKGCHEGALQMIDNKARIISEQYCDGLGACIGDCPVGAISIEEREDRDYKLSFEPHQKKMGTHLSTAYFEGKRVEHIYANIEDLKSIRRNKFMYKALDIIIDKLKNEKNIFYTESRIEDDIKMLCDIEKFKMSKQQFECCNCERIVTLAYRISDKCIKPICIYLKC